MSKRKALSISGELDILMHSVQATRLLAEQLSTEHLLPSKNGVAIRGIFANLVLIRDRLRLLDRVVSKMLPPEVIFCEENASFGREEDLCIPLDAPARKPKKR